MNRKEAKIQHALGTMFLCAGCDSSKVLSEKSDGGAYVLGNFCKACLSALGPFASRLVLSERKFKKEGYVIRQELWDDREYGGDGLFMKNAYTLDGDWIGDTNTANYLCRKKGIAPEKKNETIDICTIGYSELTKKYYGWSHRALCGFAIGDKIFQASFGNYKTKYIKHGKDTIRTKADQRKAAIAFANYVS